MGISYGTHSTVVGGLVLALDAGNTRSYGGSGTTWTDLTNNGNNGTLTNGPTYSSDDGGSIVFDGSDDYATIASSNDFAYGTGDFTWEVWIYPTNLTGNRYVLDHGSDNGGVIALAPSGDGNRYYNSTTGQSSVLYTTGFGTLSTNTWYHLVATRNSGTTSLYKNGSLTASASDSHNYPAQSITIGNYGGGGSYNFAGNISNFKIYKGKGLTEDEVKRNFSALRGRYGI